MTEIGPINRPDCTYVQVASAITARIQAGHITGKLPAERQLARELGVSYQTIRRLRERGVIITRHGRGSFLTSPGTPGTPP